MRGAGRSRRSYTRACHHLIVQNTTGLEKTATHLCLHLSFHLLLPQGPQLVVEADVYPRWHRTWNTEESGLMELERQTSSISSRKTSIILFPCAVLLGDSELESPHVLSQVQHLSKEFQGLFHFDANVGWVLVTGLLLYMVKSKETNF